MIQIQSTTETIESKGGLILAGKIAAKAGIGKIQSAFVKNAGTVIATLFGIMIEGKKDFESIGEKRGSLFFKEALDLKSVYAKETVRLYIEKMALNVKDITIQLRESAAKIIKMAPLHGLWIDGSNYLPVDIDTSAMDNSKTKKEGVSYTYRGFNGYHPIIAYIGKEGYMLDCELRPGSQHCQKGTVEFLEGVLEQLDNINASGRRLFRMDSGNDSFDTLKTITEAGKTNYCIIKRNIRRENHEEWLENAKKFGKRIESRKGKKVWVGRLEIHPEKKGETLEDINCVFEITEKKIDTDGSCLLIPEIEVNIWWTNLKCEAEKVIELYHAHATSEQFHAELKHDMDIERLPSGKFGVNEIVLAVAMNAFNALKMLGQKSIEKEKLKYHKRKRVGKVIRDLICVAGKLVKHGRELIFKINKNDSMFSTFLWLNAALDCT